MKIKLSKSQWEMMNKKAYGKPINKGDIVEVTHGSDFGKEGTVIDTDQYTYIIKLKNGRTVKCDNGDIVLVEPEVDYDVNNSFDDYTDSFEESIIKGEYDDMPMEDFDKELVSDKRKRDETIENSKKYKQPAMASNTTKIKLSKSQWEFMGRKAGWIKMAQGNKLMLILDDDEFSKLTDEEKMMYINHKIEHKLLDRLTEQQSNWMKNIKKN